MHFFKRDTTVTSPELKKKKHGCCLILLVILLISLGAQAVYFIYGGKAQQKINQALSEIQSHLIEVTSAKLIGDSLVAGKKISGASVDSVANTVNGSLQKLMDLSVPTDLKNYQYVSVLWANKIVVATENTKIWKKLNNQPGDFPLELSARQAQTFFQSSIKTIAELKKYGADAIKNKNREAMRQIAAKLLVQKHWLNALLYSTDSGRITLLATPVYASNQDPSQVPAIGQVDDVTCQLCSNPKIKWTAQLRAQYGCDTRCKPQQQQTDDAQTPQNQGQTGQTQQQQTQNENDSNNYLLNDTELESFTYKGSPKREVCIGTGGLSVGNENANKYCVEEAVQSVNEVAVSAIGFADGAKVLSVVQWEKEYEEIDDILANKPSVEGGHLLEGMGVIGTSEPDIPPQPMKATSKPKTQTKPVHTNTPVQDYSAPKIPDLTMPDQTGNPTRGSGPAPIIDLERDYSAEQTGSGRW